jgi:hypothetical protein
MRGGSFGALLSGSIAEMPVRANGHDRVSGHQYAVRDFQTPYL